MFTSPRATYQTIVAHPKPVGIMLLAILILAVSSAVPQFNPTIKQNILDQQIKAAEAGGRTMSDDQIAAMEKFSAFIPIVSVVGILVISPVIVMIFTGLYWLLFNVILGGTATFRQVLAVVSHSMIISSVGMALGAPIMILQGKMTNAGPFNLRALAMGAEPDSFLAHFLGSISVFQVWGIIVTSIGLSVLYRRKTGGIATTLLLIYLAFVACGAYFFGRFMQ